MRKALSSLAFALLAALTAAGAWKLGRRQAGPAIPALALGAPAPDFRLADLAGKTYSLSGYRGKVVLLNFWATWCPSCKQELPELDRLYAKYRGQGFVLLAPSVDENARQALMPFLAGQPLDYPVLLCDRKTADAYRIYGLPASFLIDAQGRLAKAQIGPLTISQIENDILRALQRRNS